ncbi:MAG: tyrosine-type recombinase/integrase [Steroidobacteraceae bacterium]
MANIRERRRGGKPVFQAQIRMGGYPSRTGTFPTRRMAERWAKTVEAEMIEGKHFQSVQARRRTLADAIDRYTEEELPKKRADTMHRYCLPWWRARLGHLKMADITPAAIVDARSQLAREPYTRARHGAKRTLLKPGEKPPEYKRSNSTVNRYLEVLSHVFTIARREWHWISSNPMEGVGKLHEGPGRVRFLSEEERKRLFAETSKNPQLHTLVLLALSTASRAGELLNLQWRDVDLEEGRMLLARRPGQQSRLETKNGTARAAWIGGEALRRLKEHAKGPHHDDDRVFFSPGRSGGRGVYNYDDPFGDAVKAAGLEDFHFHDLRHSAATYLARAGATEQQLRAIGGWKSNVVNKYVHLAGDDVKDLLADLSEKVGGGEEKGKDSD